MNKKVTRIFIALCLTLVMTSSTVMAASTESLGASSAISVNSTKEKTRYFHYSILANDKITDHANGRERNIYLTGHILINYDKSSRKYTLSVKDVNFQSINANGSEYSYVVEYLNDYNTRLNLYLLRNNKDICYITFSVSSSGSLNSFMHNIK